MPVADAGDDIISAYDGSTALHAEAGACTYRMRLRFIRSIEDLVYTGHIVLTR